MSRLLFIILIFYAYTAQAQEKKAGSKTIRILNAESWSFDKEKGDAQVLTGNVRCEHEGTLLNCDTALIYEQSNKMVASGHILITKGDSIRVTGDKLVYEGKDRMATLRHNVKCVEKDMVLSTELLTFDVRRSVANYYNGGTIVNKENNLVSKNGHYYSALKEATFNYDVVLTNPKYTIVCDTLKYRFSNKTAYFLGPSTITSSSDKIYCENGWYDTEKEKSAFSKNAVLTTKQQTLKGDSLTYDRTEGVGRAFRNVSLVDSAQKSVLFGDYVEYRKLRSEAFVTRSALYVRIIDADSLFLTGDTLYHKDVDSVDNFLSAYHHVRIYKKDMQAVCDSATLNSADSLMQLFGSPVLWSSNMQATSKQIQVDIGRKEVKGFRLTGKAFLSQQVDSLNTDKFQQLSGKVITGFLTNDSLRKIIVNGNAEMLYFPKNKTNLVGLNKTTASEIFIWLQQGEIGRVSLRPKTTGHVDRMSDVSSENARLKGFTWLDNRRPKSRREFGK
jgi:lipopolysaccharide export system protein LptA